MARIPSGTRLMRGGYEQIGGGKNLAGGPIKVKAHIQSGHFVRATTRAYSVNSTARLGGIDWHAGGQAVRRGTTREITRYMGGTTKTLTLTRQRARATMAGTRPPLSYPIRVTTYQPGRLGGGYKTYKPTKASLGRVQRLFGPQAARRVRYGRI